MIVWAALQIMQAPASAGCAACCTAPFHGHSSAAANQSCQWLQPPPTPHTVSFREGLATGRRMNQLKVTNGAQSCMTIPCQGANVKVGLVVAPQAPAAKPAGWQPAAPWLHTLPHSHGCRHRSTTAGSLQGLPVGGAVTAQAQRVVRQVVGPHISCSWCQGTSPPSAAAAWRQTSPDSFPPSISIFCPGSR